MLDDNNDVCVSGGFYYVISMFNLHSTALLVEVPFNNTIRKFTTLKSWNSRGGGEIHINFVDGCVEQQNQKQSTARNYLVSNFDDFFVTCL